MTYDGIGIYGSILTYSFLIALFLSTILIFIYLWNKGLVDLSEEAKYEMLKKEDE